MAADNLNKAISFNFAQMTLGKASINPFSSQLVASRVNDSFFSLGTATSLGEEKRNSSQLYSAEKFTLCCNLLVVEVLRKYVHSTDFNKKNAINLTSWLTGRILNYINWL